MGSSLVHNHDTGEVCRAPIKRPSLPLLLLPQGPLTYKGVVFNEMKGVYSSPDAVNGRVTQARVRAGAVGQQCLV